MTGSVAILLLYCVLIAALAVAVVLWGMRTVSVQAYAAQPVAAPERRRLGAVLRELHNDVATHGERCRSFGRLLWETGESGPDSVQRVRLEQSLGVVKKANRGFVDGAREKIDHIGGDFGEFGELRARLIAHVDDAEELGRMLALCDSAEAALRERMALLNTIEELQASKSMLQELLISTRLQLNEQEARRGQPPIPAEHDDLTQLPNERLFREQMAGEHARFAATGKTYSCMLIDIDDLQSINREDGHAAGNAVMVVFARVLKDMFAQQNSLSRLNGDTFAVLLPGMNAEHTELVAGRLQERIKSITVRHQDRDITFTAGIGIAAVLPGESPEALLERAREAVNCATRSRRGRIFVDDRSAAVTAAGVPE